MPLNDHGMFCLVAAHLLKNDYHYFNLDKPPDLQNHILEDKMITDITRQRVIQDFKDANKKLCVISDLECKNHINEQQQLVTELKDNLHTYRNLSFMSGISLKTVFDWCSVPKEKNVTCCNGQGQI